MSKCPVCKRARCQWVFIKDLKKATTDKIDTVISHNISYIDMVCNGNQGSSGAEERMYDRLQPYEEELERRKKGASV